MRDSNIYKKLICSALLIFLLIITIIINACRNNNTTNLVKNKPLIKADEKELYFGDFEKTMKNRIFFLQEISANNDILLALFDNYISAILLINKAKHLKYESNPEFNRLFTSYKNVFRLSSIFPTFLKVILLSLSNPRFFDCINSICL